MLPFLWHNWHVASHSNSPVSSFPWLQLPGFLASYKLRRVFSRMLFHFTRKMDMSRQLCLGVGLLLSIHIVQGAIAPTQFQVGDEAGWTLPILANVNYTSWVSGHKYHVGDTLLFTYVGEIHSVVQVSSQEEYNSCNSNNPIATHSSGKTTITLTKPGPYYFICGIPGHCSSGQKFTLIAVPTTETSTDPSANHDSMNSFGSQSPVAQPPGNSGVKQLLSWVTLLGAVSLCSSFLI